ncbi:hypothetical protein FOZ62_012079 [Perkinsus olseni]|uniref:Uncharacterized protein n=1 Tax=Perkinsus olseni TaxID=32597 RepID=A0A7J6Q8G0_PEROL|nr:hypothetical protein FOZ62_012079 [Perkinsus olseni]
MTPDSPLRLTYGSKVFILYPDGEKVGIDGSTLSLPQVLQAMVREDTITLVVETCCYAVGSQPKSCGKPCGLCGASRSLKQVCNECLRFPCERCRRQCTLAQMQGICSSCYYDKFEAHDLGPYSFD